MGAHSTLHISRKAACRFVMEKLFSMRDDALVELMDRELDDRLYRVRIVSDEEAVDDDIL